MAETDFSVSSVFLRQGISVPNSIFKHSHFLFLASLTELCNYVVSSPVSYSGGPEIECQPGDKLCMLRFLVFLLN
jgi:hypothetical protein